VVISGSVRTDTAVLEVVSLWTRLELFSHIGLVIRLIGLIRLVFMALALVRRVVEAFLTSSTDEVGYGSCLIVFEISSQVASLAAMSGIEEILRTVDIFSSDASSSNYSGVIGTISAVPVGLKSMVLVVIEALLETHFAEWKFTAPASDMVAGTFFDLIEALCFVIAHLGLVFNAASLFGHDLISRAGTLLELVIPAAAGLAHASLTYIIMGVSS
jgi:hypothetical protein